MIQSWFIKFPLINHLVPITVAAPSKSWTIFARSNDGIVGWNRAQGMDVSVYVYFVFVLFCVGSILATSWSPVQGVLPTLYRVVKLKNAARAQQKAVWPLINKWMKSLSKRIILKATLVILTCFDVGACALVWIMFNYITPNFIINNSPSYRIIYVSWILRLLSLIELHAAGWLLKSFHSQLLDI
jgi:hypothetical protein